jgi:hypothetical protein
MAADTYKNLLIVGRNVVNKSIEMLVKQRYKIWFEEGEGVNAFKHENSSDKLIIFYDSIQESDSKIIEINANITWIPKGNPLGYIIVFSRGTKILVSDIKFTGHGMKECFDSFRKYLIECIRMINLPKINDIKFTIYWRKKVIEHGIQFIHDSGLISNYNTLSHTFQSTEITSNTQLNYI